MSEWRYILKRTVARGRAARLALANQIKHLIRQRGLTIEVPVMKIETTPGAEFYIGLAVNDDRWDSDRPPDYVVDLFAAMNRPLSAADYATWPTPSNAVDNFLRGSFEWDHLTSPLHFEPFLQPALPSSLAEAEEIEAGENREAYDHLLWWCSSKGGGSVSQLSELAHELGLNDLEGSVWAVAKKLSLLGHLDVLQDQDREWVWRVAPLTVVEPTPGKPVFLAGAISGRMQQRLVESLGITLDSTNGGPSRTIIPPAHCEDLPSILGFPPRRFTGAVLRWAELLPTVAQWQANLVPDPDIPAQPHQYSFARYSGGQFVPVNDHNPRPGFYRVQRNGPQFHPKNVFHTATGHWLNGDFAGLRFLSAFCDGSPPQARWLPSDDLLMIPQQRWPTLYERALVLASGTLPTTLQQGLGKLLVYRQVPQIAAEQLASKLNVKLLV